MAIAINTPEEIEIIRESGRRLAAALRATVNFVRAGRTKIEVDQFAENFIRDGGDLPAFKNYKPAGARIAFPATLCVSVNEEIVHGIPNDYILKEGDIVGLDLGLKHRGFFTDMAVTVGIGKISAEAQKLINVTRESLAAGIKAARGGNFTGDIGYAVESVVKPHGYGIVRDMSGHGVGHSIHEEPFVPNYGYPKTGAPLRPGMVIAIEPMINIGGDDIVLAKDKFTYKTKDGSLSAHFEKTILITEGKPEIITPEIF